MKKYVIITSILGIFIEMGVWYLNNHTFISNKSLKEKEDSLSTFVKLSNLKDVVIDSLTKEQRFSDSLLKETQKVCLEMRDENKEIKSKYESLKANSNERYFIKRWYQSKFEEVFEKPVE